MRRHDRRQNGPMRVAVMVAKKRKRELGPYNAARFLCANSVPFEVALRVIVGRTENECRPETTCG